MNQKILYLVGSLFLLTSGATWAQDTDFDLASQRQEKQNVPVVPGRKIDNRKLLISPTPHQLLLDEANRLDISQGIVLKDKQKKFSADVDFLSCGKKGVKLSIDFGKKIAAQNSVKQTSGAYVLRINQKGISIVGYDERGAYYGLQTLKQVMQSPLSEDERLPYVAIDDYPDLPSRGVVEGFYGMPWSHKVRLSLIDFYGRFKLNTYVYGPKDDPYHSSRWRLPYPEKEASNIRELIETCKRNRVDFVWAIHPGQDIKWNETDFRNLVSKFNRMYDLGVRNFAIFFDDISGEGTNPLKQTELLNRLTDEFVDAKGDVAPLTICPTEYTRAWANPTPQGSLAIYGNTLHPDIKVFWTGDAVCSDLTRETLDWVDSRIKRPAYYWWNFPVTDYVPHILLQGPTYGLDNTLTAQEVYGILSNPMEHGEASKLALYGVADYAWNVGAYNPMDNWERGLKELMPNAADAYRTFAIHSCDTETGYRRSESWETTTFRLADWTDEAAKKLKAEFVKVQEAPRQIEQGCSNLALLKELRPWLTEFGKLGTRGKRAIDLMQAYRTGTDNAAFWNDYVGNLMTAADNKGYARHKSGTLKLQPFYEQSMADMAYGFLQRLTNTIPADYCGIGSFANSTTMSARLMFDRDTTTYYTSGISQKKGDWIGVDLRTVRDVSGVRILQGRNSVDDCDFFDHAIVEYSENGETWKPLTGELHNQYIICWSGDAVRARYVRIKRLDSTRNNYAAIRSFEVNTLQAEQLPFILESDEPQSALAAFDNSLVTIYKMEKQSVSCILQSDVKHLLLLTGHMAAPLKCTQWSAEGVLMAETEIQSCFTRIDLVDGAYKVKLEGTAEIFEILPECNSHNHIAGQP